jgi:hypothetical protein
MWRSSRDRSLYLEIGSFERLSAIRTEPVEQRRSTASPCGGMDRFMRSGAILEALGRSMGM